MRWWTCPLATSPSNNSMLIWILLLAICAISAANSDYRVRPIRLQGDAPYSHRRLYGIRRLKVIRPLVKPTPPEVERTASVRRHQSSDGTTTNLADYVPRAQIPPKLLDSSETVLHPIVEPPAQQRTNKPHPPSTTTTTEPPASPTAVLPKAIEDFDEAKRRRIEARWKRLGINLRTIKYPIRRTNREKSMELEKLSIFSKSRSKNTDSSNEKHLNHASAQKDDIRVAATENTRKSVPSMASDKDISPPRRPRIHGPLLSVVAKDEDARENGFGHNPVMQTRISSPSSSSELPSAPRVVLPRFVAPVVTPTPSGDYHSRTTPVFKSYKYAQKLSQRPRLRIRRPGEKAVSENSIQEDPNLTPFQNSARTRFGYGNRGGGVGPVAYHRTIRPASFSSEVPTSIEATTESPPPPPITTTTEATTTTEDPAPSEPDTGESGAGFGFGPSELPPELANVGFGIGGNGINFNMPAPKAPPASSETKPHPKRPKQRKQPNPEIFKEEGEPLVIPQNSGLRPVAPPKEFLEGGAGFGSGSGSSGVGFGGGSAGLGSGAATEGGDFGGASGGAGSGLSAGAGPDSNPDIFTGDSALTPSHGPTGDGYGPPIFPGGAIPPPVPAVGLGGAAAGKSPYGAMMEATENPPTTMKPSALLNMLNKADQGINQAITHFEQRSPLETAAIDILEVALGSQKLDSQAKLLGHVDRAIGLDNLQRIQRWANTAGAMDVFKEEMVKFIKNFEPPEDILPTLPPQLDYLFKPSGR